MLHIPMSYLVRAYDGYTQKITMEFIVFDDDFDFITFSKMLEKDIPNHNFTFDNILCCLDTGDKPLGDPITYLVTFDNGVCACIVTNFKLSKQDYALDIFIKEFYKGNKFISYEYYDGKFIISTNDGIVEVKVKEIEYFIKD